MQVNAVEDNAHAGSNQVYEVEAADIILDGRPPRHDRDRRNLNMKVLFGQLVWQGQPALKF